jgi:hypothetical protein
MGRSLTIILAASVAVALGVAGCTPPSGSSSPTTTTPPVDQTGPIPLGPAEVVDGIPHGWRHDGDGARAAAIAAVSVTGDIARAGFITRDDLIESIASTNYAGELAALSARQLEELSIELGEAGVASSQLVWSEIPLRARSISSDERLAVVDVWSVLVVGVPGVGAPRQVWRTVTVRLVWERDDWRIDGWDASAGPTPALASAAEVSSVEDIAGVLAWPPPNGVR